MLSMDATVTMGEMSVAANRNINVHVLDNTGCVTNWVNNMPTVIEWIPGKSDLHTPRSIYKGALT